MKWLWALYLVLIADVVTGLNLNLYGFGREPLLFALGTVVVACVLYRWTSRCLGMIGLILCCAWLLVYPAKNGFDVVLSPLVFIGSAMWLWQKFKSKP